MEGGEKTRKRLKPLKRATKQPANPKGEKAAQTHTKKRRGDSETERKSNSAVTRGLNEARRGREKITVIRTSETKQGPKVG